ncbi:uncharacterized protein LOC131940999 [Physella acuta]|uniref:uncharacterized protein LOC131940999 n=1 Tax=Physella acuta TaxID=109671 RepID=UPI0027DBD968|nr:uncharacterized protein LOC131940999 [Physella acuta]
MAYVVFRVCLVLCLTILLNGQETDVVGGSQTNTTAAPSLPNDTTPGLAKSDTNTPDQQASPVADNSTNIDSGTDGEADDLASYIVEKIGQLFNSDTEAENVVSTTPGQQISVDCQHVADLRDYYPGDVPFEGNTTVRYLLESVFKPDVVKLLQTDCGRGSWCLSSGYTQKFDDRGPFCYTEVWSALNSMMRLRENCDEKELTLLTNVINLLCGLCSEGTQDCCARTLEALYVTYADLTHPNGTQKEALAHDDCNEYKVQMTKTYLCADDVCYFDQRVLLESYDAWRVISTNASSMVLKCNITYQCQTLMPTTPSYYGDYSDDLSKDYEQELEELVEELEKLDKDLSTQQPTPAFGDAEISTPAFINNEEVNPKVFNQDEYAGDNSEINNENTYGVDTDRTMLLGLISMTIVLVLGLVAVAYVGLKKYRRHLYANYRRGYSQLREEESKMLRQEYN